MRTTISTTFQFALLLAVSASFSTVARRAFAERHGPSAIKWADGARAPVDTWTQDDGCPARTGATESPAMTGPREVAWKLTVPGEVEGEPLVWKNRTFVVEKAGNKRTLHVLDSLTGVEKLKQTFDSGLPLAPCVYDGRVILRSGLKTVQGFSVGEKALVSRWTVTAKTGIGPPTVFRDEVYLVVDGALERRTFGSAERTWPKAGAAGIKVEGVSVQGLASGPAKGGVPPTVFEYPRPSLRENSVFIATGSRLVEVDRVDGSSRREGKLAGPVDPRLTKVVVGLADVIVLLGAKVKGEGGDVDASRFTLVDSGPFGTHQSLAIPFGITAVGREWVGVVGKGSGSPLALWMFEGVDPEPGEDRRLAHATMHPEFLETKVAPSSAGDVVFVGGRAFDGDTLDLIRPEPMACVSRSIPLRERLLVVESKKVVTAWKSGVKRPDVAALKLFGAGATTTLPAGHAVLDDGRVVVGAFSIDAKTGGLVCTGAATDSGTWPWASVKALVADETPKRLLLAARPEDAAEAVSILARKESVGDVLATIPQALAVNDAALARRAQNAAAERGALPADLSKTSKDVDALEAKGVDRDFEKAGEIEAKLNEVLAREPGVLVEVAGSMPTDAPIGYAATLVRLAAERSRFHKGAADWVRAHLPEGLSPRTITDVGEWIDFIETGMSAKIMIFGPKTKIPDGVPTSVGERLATERAEWRPDVVGFLNGPLLVMAPPEHPSAITRCLALGRIVSDQLDVEFAAIGPRKTEDEVMALELFPNKAEYIHQSTRGEGQEARIKGLEHTGGHYSPTDNVTRIYFTPGDGDSVFGTYEHELTHHWIGRRRPGRTPDEELVDHAGGPGYFCVEGYAEFMHYHAFDEVALVAKPENPRNYGCDVVASCPEASLVPWSKLVGMSQREAYAGDHDKTVKLALHWRLGDQTRLDMVTLYYAQAAAATTYLYLADGGKYRAALLKHLYDHYAGESDPDALYKAVGCSADELGVRIVKWCKSTVGVGSGGATK